MTRERITEIVREAEEQAYGGSRLVPSEGLRLHARHEASTMALVGASRYTIFRRALAVFMDDPNLRAGVIG